MDDERFENDLRAMLRRRDPGQAPAGLAAVIAGRLTLEPARPRLALARRGLSALAAAAAVVVLAVGLAVLLRPGSEAPVASSAPLPSAGLAPAPGDGVTNPDVSPAAQVLAWMVAAAVVVAVGIRAKDRRVTVVATLAMVGLVWVAANIGRSDALVDSGGIIGINPESSRQDDAPGTFVGVTGDQPFRVMVRVTNTSRLPLEIRGLVPTPVFEGYDPPIVPRFVALANLPEAEFTYEAARPFRPTVLGPQESANLLLLGMAGSCALATPPADRIGGGFTSLDAITLVYEQLTIVHVENVPLQEKVNVWWPDACPPGA